MIAAVLLAATCSGQETFYDDVSLHFKDELLGWRVVEGLGTSRPGAQDLALTVLLASGERELRLHRIGSSGVDQKPRKTIPVKGDVVAWSMAQVRPEAGLELVLMTRSGAWSYSTTKEGYRGNVAPLARAELVFDLPSPRHLPYWDYLLPGSGRDQLLLPELDGLSRWSPNPKRTGPYEREFLFDLREVDTGDASEEDEGVTSRYAKLRNRNGPFIEDSRSAASTMISSAHGYDAPALVDIDGDGRRDLLMLHENTLAVHLGADSSPTRVEPIPPYLDPGEGRRQLIVADVDGDRDLDLVAVMLGSLKEAGNGRRRILIMVNDGKRLLPERATQALTFEATELVVEVTDVNGDGRPDLVVRKMELPDLTGAITGLEFRFTHLVFFGEGKAFTRKPALKHLEIYDEESVAGAIQNYELVRDCDGDGVADLVAIDLQGRVTVRRVQFTKGGFFRSDAWELERTPWKMFDIPGAVVSLEVVDLNGDGLGDLVSSSPGRLNIMLSRRAGGRR